MAKAFGGELALIGRDVETAEMNVADAGKDQRIDLRYDAIDKTPMRTMD